MDIDTSNHVPDRMNLHLVIAAWRSQGSRTAYCYAETMRYLAQRHDVTHETWCNDAILERTRSQVLTRFLLHSKADVFIWADADMVWRTYQDRNDFERLAETAYRTRGVVGAIYSKRGFKRGLTVRACRDNQPKYVATGADTLLRAELVATGFQAIHRSALERIAASLPWVAGDEHGDWLPFCKTELVPLDDGRMRFVAEDAALCENAMRCGVPVLCDVFPVLGHEGSHIFTAADGYEGERQQP